LKNHHKKDFSIARGISPHNHIVTGIPVPSNLWLKTSALLTTVDTNLFQESWQ